MATRLLLRPILGGVIWTGGGVGASVIIPNVLCKLHVIDSTGIVSAAFFCGTFAVLFPLGVTRGVITGVQEVSESTQPRLEQAFRDLKLEGSRILTQDASAQQLLERLTLGSGWQGRLARTMASPFLPSTAQMMVRVQEAIDKNRQTPSKVSPSSPSDGQVVAAAVGGYIEGFLQDKKDTFTMLGSVAYLAILGIGFGVDYAYNHATSATDDKQGSSPDSIAVQSKPNDANNAGTLQVDSKDNTEKELSWKETIDAAQIQVGEMAKSVVKGKKQLDPYLEQAGVVIQVTRDEINEQAHELYKAVEKALTDEENQKLVKEKWRDLAEALENAKQLGDDQTVRKMSDELENLMQRARNRLNDKEFQEMKNEAENIARIARKKFEEGKVDERLEQAKESMEQQSKNVLRRLGDWLKGDKK